MVRTWRSGHCRTTSQAGQAGCRGVAHISSGSLVAGIQAADSHHGAAGQQLPIALEGPLGLILVLHSAWLLMEVMECLGCRW